MPGYSKPTIAIFPFRWYESGNRWIIQALKLQPDNSLKWCKHFIEDNGRAKVEAYENYEDARTAALAFNEGIRHRVSTLGHEEDLRLSLILKAEKEVTVQQRLAQEEQLMFVEAMKRNRSLAPPNSESLVLPKGREDLREDLYLCLSKAPQVKIIQLARHHVTLLRSGESDWSRIVSTNTTAGKYCHREIIARGFGLSGKDHWGRTKALIRSMLLPRANQLLQLASVQRILAEALAKGQRVIVIGGFVFWYEEDGGIGWIVKGVGGESKGENGDTLWHEGTIISKNHGRIVVLPYIKENGEKVQGHTKNAANDGKALPRHPDNYLELPFEILDGDLMIGLFGELHYD